MHRAIEAIQIRLVDGAQSLGALFLPDHAVAIFSDNPDDGVIRAVISRGVVLKARREQFARSRLGSADGTGQKDDPLVLPEAVRRGTEGADQFVQIFFDAENGVDVIGGERVIPDVVVRDRFFAPRTPDAPIPVMGKHVVKTFVGSPYQARTREYLVQVVVVAAFLKEVLWYLNIRKQQPGFRFFSHDFFSFSVVRIHRDLRPQVVLVHANWYQMSTYPFEICPHIRTPVYHRDPLVERMPYLFFTLLSIYTS